MERFAFVIFLALGLVACAPVTPAVTQVAAVPPAASAGEYHPLTARTGMAEFDAILAAAGDVEELRSLIGYTEAGCTWRDGLGGPPKCRQGESEGTPVEALPFLGSEGGHLRRDEIENWTGINASGVYAIYDNSAGVYEEEYYPAGESTILFAGRPDGEPVALRIQGGRIVRIDSLYGFGMDSLDSILQREAENLILEPPAARSSTAQP